LQQVARDLPLSLLLGCARFVKMGAVALVAYHQSFFEHELHQLQRGCISTVLTQRFVHLAHGAGALTPQHRQDGYFGVGWKRRGSGLFGVRSGGHASSIIRIYSYVNEIIRMTGAIRQADFGASPAEWDLSSSTSLAGERVRIGSAQ